MDDSAWAGSWEVFLRLSNSSSMEEIDLFCLRMVDFNLNSSDRPITQAIKKPNSNGINITTIKGSFGAGIQNHNN